MALTIRLLPEEIKELEKIKEYSGKLTSSGTIKQMIITYLDLVQQLEDAENKLIDLTLERDVQEETLKQVKSTFRMLCSIEE